MKVTVGNMDLILVVEMTFSNQRRGTADAIASAKDKGGLIVGEYVKFEGGGASLL